MEETAAAAGHDPDNDSEQETGVVVGLSRGSRAAGNEEEEYMMKFGL